MQANFLFPFSLTSDLVEQAMCLTLFASLVTWAFDKAKKIERRTFIVLADPYVFISGGLAAAAARAAIIPIDSGGPKGVANTIYRRIPQWGLVMWIYVPLAKHILPERGFTPERRAKATFYLACFAGLLMRVICNPINAIRDEAIHSSFQHAAKKIWRDKGVAGFYMNQHPLFTNMFYFGTTVTLFEAFRRYSENKGAPMDNVFSNALCNGGVGLAAATVGSTLLYPLSKMRYDGLARDCVINHSLRATLLQEVPMTGVFFFTFSLLQPLFAPHHGKRCGFGY